jgi:lipopolysaccharide/colanic/teichoic acid biosynthesis glycosyltransferase
MLKRGFDILFSLIGLVVIAIPLLILMFWVWLDDRHSPFYIGQRVGRGGKPFGMIKLRSMRVNADKVGGSSTAGNDPRITRVGRIIRAGKFDEFTQLINVLKGDMSLVGPRPQVEWAVKLYTPEETRLVSVRPGITDLASIVFSDEGEILRGASDPDRKYDEVIRPWKSRLALLGVERQSLKLDLEVIVLTVLNSVSRKWVLARIANRLQDLNAHPRLVDIASRRGELVAELPPGRDWIYQHAG